MSQGYLFTAILLAAKCGFKDVQQLRNLAGRLEGAFIKNGRVFNTRAACGITAARGHQAKLASFKGSVLLRGQPEHVDAGRAAIAQAQDAAGFRDGLVVVRVAGRVHEHAAALEPQRLHEFGFDDHIW